MRGCGRIQTLTAILFTASFSLFLPAGNALADCSIDPATFNVVSHDLSNSFCELCGTGPIRIIVSNTDTQALTGITVTENLGTSGLEYVPGSTTVDGVPVADPDTSAYPLVTWNTGQVPDLAGTPNPLAPTTHVIEFQVRRIAGTEEGLVTASRLINASASFDFQECFGNPVWPRTTDTTGPQTLPLREPVPSITKLGRNVDAAQGGYTNPVYGNTNDDVIWRIEIGNGGLAALQDLKFNDLMDAGNMSVNFACPSEIDALAVANNNGADPGGTGCVGASNSITDFVVEDPFGQAGIPADVAAGGIAQVYLVGKLTSSCFNRDNTASNIEWGCVTNAPAGGISATSTGATPGASAATLGTLVDNNGLQIQRQISGTNPGQPAGTKGAITITITNNTGGTVKNIQLNDVLPTVPTYYVVDSTFTPTIAVTPAYGAYPGMTDTITWTNPNGDPLLNTSPTFTLTSSTTHPNYADQVNMLRNGDVLTVSFRIILVNSSYYDKQANLDVRQELAGVDDPANMPQLTNQLYVTFEQYCNPGVPQQASSYPFNDNFTPSPEDIDVDITGTELIFILTNDPTQRLPLTVQLRNRGGHDAADHFTYVSFGETMTVVTAPAGCAVTTNPPPRPVWDQPEPIPGLPTPATVYECTSGVLAPNATRNLNFEVIKNLASTADDLSFRADVVGEVRWSDGTPLTDPVPADPIGSTVNNYSLDGIRARVLGFNLQKSQLGNCTENNPPPGSPDDLVQIGEECSFHIDTGGWFGFQTPGFTYIAVQNIQVVDELPNGQGYISSTDPTLTSDPEVQGISLNPLGLAAPDEGWIDWTFNQAVRITDKDKWFRVDVSTRLLNDPIDTVAAPNQHAAISRNVLNSYFEAIFRNALGVDEVFNLGPGTVGYPQASVRRVDLTVTEPNITVVKEVCNETLYGVGPACSTFVPLANNGDTNDSYVYRIRLTNQATASGVARAPAYNVNSTDVLDGSDLMYVVPFGSDGLDNDGDGLVDGADPDEGSIINNVVSDGTPAQITFSHTHSAPLLRVDPGASVTFYYRVDPDDAIAPLQALTNTVTMTYDSLDGDFGNQSNPQRANSDIAGARVYTTTPAQATVQILPVLAQPKQILRVSNTAISGPPQPVSIGEEVEYQLTAEIPVSHLRSFVIRDELPAGIRCIEAPAINLSAGVYAAAGFVPGGTFTPTCTSTGTNDVVEWNFGDQELTTAGGTRFTFPVSFIARVENTAVTNDTNIVSNGAPATSATVSYINEVGATVTNNFSSADVIVSEPRIALTKAFSQASTDAGDVLTVTVIATNTGSATAYNLRVLDNLVGTKLTFINSVSGTDPPDTIDTTTLGANSPIFSWNAANPDYAIAPGASISFTFTVSVDIDVEPAEVLSNTLQASWQSLPDLNTALNATGAIDADGSVMGMRNGAIPNAGDAINDYETTTTATIPVLPVSIAKTRLGDTYGAGADVRIGDIVEYELRLTLPEGTSANVVLTDALPQGLQYEQTVSVNGDTAAPYTQAAPFTHADFAGAVVAGDATTGPTSVTWTLGQIVNAGDNDAGNNDFVIIYRARVLNLVHPQVNNIALTNVVSLDYDRGGAPAPTLTDTETVNLVQPAITVSKAAAPANGDTVLDAGELVTYTVDLVNTGAAPAYDVVLQDVIPVGLRNGAATITMQSITLVPAGTVLPNLAPVYNAGTGVAVWNFDTGVADQYTIPVGQTLRVVYQVQAEADLGASLIMTNQAQAQNYYSFDDEAVPTLGGIVGVREIYGPSNVDSVTLTSPGPNPLSKLNPKATATIGETFTYRITVPGVPQPIALHDVVILDDLSASAADLVFVGVSRVSGSQAWTPVNTGTASNLVIQDTGNGIDIPAGEQIEIDITVRLANTGTNIAGLLFNNTASYRFNQINGDIGSQLNGGADTTPNMTVVEPAVTLAKTGPAQVQFGIPATFTLNVQNTGTSRAWDLTITDRIPDNAGAGMCDAAPTAISANIFLADGTTLVSALVEGTDYVSSFSPAPACTLTLTMQSTAAAIDPTNRLIVTYQAVPDNDNAQGATLTNIAAATQWFSLDTAGAGATGDTRTYTGLLTDGTITTLDEQDAHTVTSEVPVLEFRKSVINLTTGQNPGANASPGDTLRYRIALTNLSAIALNNFRLTDEVDRLSGGTAVFAPGTLNIVSVPGGADTSNTDVNGGALGTGLLDVRNLNLGINGGGSDTLVIEFDVTLAPVLASGTVVLNQAQILITNYTTLASDDPNVNGLDDPVVLGDEDPTRTVIASAPVWRVQKVSQDLTGDPAVLVSGDTLRYTITVKNIGNENAVGATLRDQIPANTTYVANSTRLNGTPVADPSAGVSALQNGLLINAPENTTPGFMRADADIAANNVATITFDVTVNNNVVNGAIISNQGFVNGSGAGSGAFPEQPSDDPATAPANDPTVDIVGNLPLIDSQKTVQILNDTVNPGILDPGETLRYTITVTNYGATVASNVSLTDAVPANTTYIANSVFLNGLPVGQPDGGVSPLIAGIPISTSDLTPPLPAAGNGTLSVGATATVTFDTTVNGGTPSGTVISNQGSVTSNEQAAEPTDADGNDGNGDQPTQIVVGNAQQLAITKSVSVVGGGVALAGGELEYVVQVTNIGSVPANNVVITDNMVLAQFTYVPGSATLNGAAAGTSYVAPTLTADYWATYGALAPAATATLRFRVQLDGALAIGTTITNTGRVDWNAGTQNDTASVSIDIGGSPGVANLNGRVWHDADFDNTTGAGERRLQNWSVEIYRNSVLLDTRLTDVNGDYAINGLAPNDVSGDQYELRFRAPGAGANTASLGLADSVFTNAPQRIWNIVVGSGANTQNLNLPIDPSGVVYDSVSRVPVAGATLTLLQGGSPVNAGCLDDPVQQGQVTLVDGYYKFDLNFSDGSCPLGANYVIRVTPPASGYNGTPSLVIPPISDGATLPYSVPTCSADAIAPVPAGYCEAQASEFAPGLAVPPATAGTNHYLHLTLNNPVPGGSQLFNNHISLDPVITGTGVSITKTTPMVNVTRGQLVPYTITAVNNLGGTLGNNDIVDTIPPGFKYVTGSATLNGARVEPTVAGRELRWTGVSLPASTPVVLKLMLVIGSGVGEGDYINQAYVYNNILGTTASGMARATVRVIPDPTFDCTDVVGKVFDDRNGNGLQDPGEPGLAGARVVTAQGLLVDADKHGRYHIGCAAVPNPDRGSNFVLKLDTRSLPSGYRVTSENPRVVRLTRGKMVKVNFGAAIHRVVRLDISDAAFEPVKPVLRPEWREAVDDVLKQLKQGPAVLRIAYLGDAETDAMARARIANVRTIVLDQWRKLDRDSLLTIETELFWRRGGPGADGGGAGVRDGVSFSHLGANVAVNDIGENTEYLLPDAQFTVWAKDHDSFRLSDDDRVFYKKRVVEDVRINNIEQPVAPLSTVTGVPDVSPATLSRLKALLRQAGEGRHLRLHLTGHTDDQPLSASVKAQYPDHVALSRAQAAMAADYFREALGLTAEQVSVDGKGSAEPLQSNATAEGQLANRRVEVKLWFETVSQSTINEPEVIPRAGVKRLRVCRVEPACITVRKTPGARRMVVRRPVAPVRFGDNSIKLAPADIEQLRTVVNRYRDKPNWQLRFTGHVDNLPISKEAATRYGDKTGLARAHARVVAEQVRQALALEDYQVAYEGAGDAEPLADNNTPQGRSQNRRVEVSLWFDAPEDVLSVSEPQVCPADADGRDFIARRYQPNGQDPIGAVSWHNGKPVINDQYRVQLKGLLEFLKDKRNLRIVFAGYTENSLLNRRGAQAYGDNWGLSAARARAVRDAIQQQLNLPDSMLAVEGRGLAESGVIDQGRVLQAPEGYVELEIWFDVPAPRDDNVVAELLRIQRKTEPVNPFTLAPLRITVDGKRLDGSLPHMADVQRCTDVALDQTRIRLSYDGHKTEPRLNVIATPSTVAREDNPDTPVHENAVEFQGYSNYPALIEKAEVRLFGSAQSLDDEPLKVIALDNDMRGNWQARWSTDAALKYVLRVYDKAGRYDETRAKRIWVVKQGALLAQAANSVAASSAGVYGESTLARRGIPVTGGTITVNAQAVPRGHQVWVMNRPVPVDTNGRLVSQQIIPKGLHTVEVAVLDAAGNGQVYLRDLGMTNSDWFYTGIADVTLGMDQTSGPASLVTGDTSHYNNGLFGDGRFAFYLKGSTRGGIEVTVSADTQEGALGDLFGSLMDKKPQYLFRRLDRDYEGYVYPTFGDDSKITEDAPTQGRFYLKAKKGNNFGMWGNFKAHWLDTDLARVDRGLYGAYGHYESAETTGFGAARTRTDTFVAEPGTVRAREEFRGTGGSLYFLRHQDISQGAETVWVEVRDQDSGFVLKTNHLIPGQDYTIDAIQGRVQLVVPLPSTADSSQLVQAGSLSGHPVYLVVHYEYVPGLDQLNDMAVGLRGSRWMSENVKLGFTYTNEEQQGAPQNLSAVDVTWRKSASTYLKFEAASTTGLGLGEYSSQNGGYHFTQIAQPSSANASAGAQRVEMSGQLQDFIASSRGRFNAYFQQRGAGFSAPGQLTARDTTQFGGSYNLPIDKFSDFNVKFDAKKEDLGLNTQALNLDYGLLVGGDWKMTAGLRHDSREDQSLIVPVTQTQGDRTDAAVRMTYEKEEDWKAYYFAQATVQRSGTRNANNRLGAGGEYQATDKLSLKGELSGGDLGLGARFGADYKLSDDSNLYSTYVLDNERDVSGLRAMKGNFVNGFRSKTSESMSVYGEERYTHGDVPTGLTHAYGVDFKADNEWRYGAAFEMGSLRDPQTAALTDRKALSLSAARTDEAWRYSGAFEYRIDDGSTSSRTTYLLKNRVQYQTDDNWRLFGKFNYSDSSSTQGEFYDGQFIETVFGYAFRPVDNDRWNTVMKYTFFYNMPSPDQISLGSAAADYIQRSHVLAVDTQYDLNPRWTVGGKFAYRFGQLSADRVNPEFFASRGQLIALRADWHIVRHWDVILEGRLRSEIDAQDARSGMLVGAYRHLGNNIKLGAGYNFANFSDDLTNLDYSSQGLFINVIGKF